jgi:hypothetical protein
MPPPVIRKNYGGDDDDDTVNNEFTSSAGMPGVKIQSLRPKKY